MFLDRVEFFLNCSFIKLNNDYLVKILYIEESYVFLIG